MNSHKISPKTDTSFWDERRGKIHSHAGKWIGGEEVFVRDYRLFADLIGQVSYMQLLILNATGRLVDKKIADWIEGNFGGLSYPDARIWCNQIAALSASSGVSVPAAVMAGTLGADSRAYGSQTNRTTILFLQAVEKELDSGKSLDSIIESAAKKEGKPDISGFARPVSRNDERIRPYEELRLKLDIPRGKYLDLALKIDDYLAQEYGLGINSGGYASAFLADQGFSADEAYHIKAFSVAVGALACAVDNKDAGQHSFLPLQCEDIEYTGVADRELP